MLKNFSIYLRRDSVGGAVAPEPRFTSTAEAAREHLVVMVHGYNVSERAGEKSFALFEAEIQNLRPAVSGGICRVYWPGDSGVPFVRPLAYPIRLHTAISCAPHLARFLHERRTPNGKPTALLIVGHSLGCRLVVEALKHLLTLERVEDRDILVVLMAAAVPVEAFAPTGDLLSALAPSIRRVVLYSPADLVLKLGFAAGQQAAEPWRRFPQQAVGRFGLPEKAVWTDRREMYNYGHGDYWREPGVHLFISRNLATPVVQLRGQIALGNIAERALTEHQMPERDTEAA